MWHNQAILTESEFVLNGSLRELQRLVTEIKKFCREHSLSQEVEFDLNLVLEELFTNSVNHGGCAGMQDAIEIRLRLEGDAVRVEFADRGRPFNPSEAPVPDLEAALEDRSLGGLGVHLVRQIVRGLEYRRAGGWNRVTMRLPC